MQIKTRYRLMPIYISSHGENTAWSLRNHIIGFIYCITARRLLVVSAVEAHSNQLVDYLLFHVVSAIEVHSNQLVDYLLFHVVFQPLRFTVISSSITCCLMLCSEIEAHSNQLVNYLLFDVVFSH